MRDNQDEARADIDTAAVAAAVGWDQQALLRVLTDPDIRAELLEICSIAQDLRVASEPGPGFESRTLQALAQERAHSAMVAPTRAVAKRAVVAVAVCVMATLTTLFALLATTAGGDGVFAIAVASLGTGILVSARDVFRSRTHP